MYSLAHQYLKELTEPPRMNWTIDPLLCIFGKIEGLTGNTDSLSLSDVSGIHFNPYYSWNSILVLSDFGVYPLTYHA